jgi:prevent-host-death family protein
MVAVRLRDLEERTAEVVRRVAATGEPVEIMEDGRVLAILVPVEEAMPAQEEIDEFWREFDELSEEISASWPEGVSAVDAIRDVRRDL